MQDISTCIDVIDEPLRNKHSQFVLWVPVGYKSNSFPQNTITACMQTIFFKQLIIKIEFTYPIGK